MIDFGAVKNAWYDWADGVTAFEIWWANQNAPQRDKPYVVMRIQTILPVGWDAFQDADSSGVTEMVGNRDITLNLQAFGDDAMQELEKLFSSLSKFTILEPLRVVGIAYVDRLAINNITDLEDTRFFERWSMDLLFRIASVETDTPGFIDKNIIDGEYYKNGTKVLDQTISINT